MHNKYSSAIHYIHYIQSILFKYCLIIGHSNTFFMNRNIYYYLITLQFETQCRGVYNRFISRVEHQMYQHFC
jgi:hypothetical protein